MAALQIWGSFRVRTGLAVSDVTSSAKGIRHTAPACVLLVLSFVIACVSRVSRGFLCLQGFLSTSSDVWPETPFSSASSVWPETLFSDLYFDFDRKKTRPHNNILQGLSAVLGVSPLRNVFLGVDQ